MRLTSKPALFNDLNIPAGWKKTLGMMTDREL